MNRVVKDYLVLFGVGGTSIALDQWTKWLVRTNIYYYPRVEADDWTLKLAMGLQLGGAAGNLIDRLRVGRVTDFISVGSFPVFNIADASISVGVAVLLLGVWINERNEKLKAAEQASENGEQLSANDESLPVLDPVDGPVSGEQPKMNGGQS